MSREYLINDHTYLKNVCIFCYEAEVYTRKEDFKIIKQFLNCLERCAEDVGVDKRRLSVYKEDFQKSCCVDCLGVVKSFCDMYHQLKCLEIQMDSNLMCLLDTMKFADKIPSRLKTLQSVLTPIKTLKLKSFRKLVIIKCHRRLSKSQPRVVLKRIPKLFSDTRPSQENVTVDPKSLDSNIEMDDQDDNYGEDDHEIPFEMDLDNVEEAVCEPLGDVQVEAVSAQPEQSCETEIFSVKVEESPVDNDTLELERIIPKQEISESFHLEHEDTPKIPSPTTERFTSTSTNPEIPSPSIKITHVRSIKKTAISKIKRIRFGGKSSECIHKRRSKNHFKVMHDKTGVDPSDIRKWSTDHPRPQPPEELIRPKSGKINGYICKICGKNWGVSKGARDYCQKKHVKGIKHCSVCDKYLKQEKHKCKGFKALNSYDCPFCMKNFKRTHNRNRHMKTCKKDPEKVGTLQSTTSATPSTSQQ